MSNPPNLPTRTPASRIPHRWQRRLELLVGAYLVVGVFGLATIVLGVWQRELSTTELIAAAAIAVSPLALALVWDRLAGAKVGPVEVSFSEVAATLDLGIADQFQSFDSVLVSDSLPIVEQMIASMRGAEAPRLLGINLHDGKYWWATRLFLLAALADDYTNIETLVFVEGGADKHYVGMASPASLRRAMARRSSDSYEIAYRYAADLSLRGGRAVPVARQRSAEQQTTEIVMHWGDAITKIAGRQPQRSQRANRESELKEVVGHSELTTWLASELDTRSVEWDGLPLTDEIRYLIVTQPGVFVALTQRGRLEKIVDRVELAARISQKALEYVMASGRR